MEVIRSGVEDDRPANYLRCTEAPGQHLHVGLPKVCQKRRQISCMIWMVFPPGIEMAAGVGKPFTAAVPSLMDMKREKPRFRIRKPCYLRFDDNAITALEKFHCSPYPRIGSAASNPRNGNWTCAVFHFIAPYTSYASKDDSARHSFVFSPCHTCGSSLYFAGKVPDSAV